MIVVSSTSMCCMDCGGFHFLAQDGVVYHPRGVSYQQFDPAIMTSRPCSNSGKYFRFPAQPPTKAIEVDCDLL